MHASRYRLVPGWVAHPTLYLRPFGRSCAQSAFKRDSPSAWQEPRNLLCCSLFHSGLCQFLHTLYKGLRPDRPLESLVATVGQSCNALPLVLVFLRRLNIQRPLLGPPKPMICNGLYSLHSQVPLVRVCRRGESFHLADFPFLSYFPLLAEPRLHQVEDNEQSLVGLSHTNRLSIAGAGHFA